MEKKAVILGVLGVDAHVVGNKLMEYALGKEGFKVVNLGTFVSQEDFIRRPWRRMLPSSWWVPYVVMVSWTVGGSGRIASRPEKGIFTWSSGAIWS